MKPESPGSCCHQGCLVARWATESDITVKVYTHVKLTNVPSKGAISKLVGGFLPPHLKNMLVKLDDFQFVGVNIKKIETTT